MSPTSPPTPSLPFNRLLARGRLRHLQLLIALADTGTVQQAANVVGMSQPAATQALSDLEDLFESQLFERHSKGVRPTLLGMAVIPTARNVINALRASTDSIAALKFGNRKPLRLGCIPAAASGLLYWHVPRLLADYPDWRIELFEESSERLLPELSTGRLDALVCRRPPTIPERWRFEPLQEDRPVIMVAATHPCADRGSVTLHDLVDFPWLIGPPNIGVHQLFKQLWSNQPVQPTVYPLASTSLIVSLEVLYTRNAVSIAPHSMVRASTMTRQVVVLDVALPDMPEHRLESLGLLCAMPQDSAELAILRERLRIPPRSHDRPDDGVFDSI